MSEFDQVDSRKDQAADDDVTLEQCDGFDASYRASSASISAKRRGDPDCLGQLIESKAREHIPTGHSDATYVRHLTTRRLAWLCRAAVRLVAIRPGFMRH